MRLNIYNWAHEARVTEILSAYGLEHNHVQEIADSGEALAEALRLSARLWRKGLNVMLTHGDDNTIVLFVDTKLFLQR